MSKSQKEEIDSPSLLNRKTKRENNTNSVESLNNNQVFLPNEIRCSICLKYQKFSSKCYKCSICSSYFHLDCYNLFSLNKDGKETTLNENNMNTLNNFTCIRCTEEKKNNSKYICHLCGEHDGIIKKFKDNQYIHHYCYIFFKENLNHPKNGRCNNCKAKNIPTIKCEYHLCKNKYHMKCALEKGIIFSLPFMREENDEGNKKETFNERIPFFCETHNKDIINSYTDYLYAMTQSLNDKRDNNPINEITYNDNNNNSNNKNNNNDNNNGNNNNNDNNINNGNNNNNDNNNNNGNTNNNNINNNTNNIENTNINNSIQKSAENINEDNKYSDNSLSSIMDDNFGSNNDSREPNEKSTPVNDYSSNKINTSNEKNSAGSNNIISNDNNVNNNNNNNNDIINVTVTKKSNELNDNENKNELNNDNKNKENISNEKNNDNIDDEIENQIDIKMGMDNDEKNNNDKENKDNNNNNDNNNIEEDENEEKVEEKEKEKYKDKDKEKENIDMKNEEYKIPEIKREPIDLFENFRKMNEDYFFPGSFYRFHGI